jgi:hypothetical protein
MDWLLAQASGVCFKLQASGVWRLASEPDWLGMRKELSAEVAVM